MTTQVSAYVCQGINGLSMPSDGPDVHIRSLEDFKTHRLVGCYSFVKLAINTKLLKLGVMRY
jgi:hypothetical protein